MDKLKGIIPPMITPLKGNDELDREGAVRLVEHMLKGGVHALFILGTTGEAQSLTYNLRYEFVELVLKQVAGRVPVLVGVTDVCIERVRDRYRALGDMKGIDGIVSTVPYYSAVNQEEIYTFYNEIANFSARPVYLYDLPVVTKSPTTAATVKKLWKNSNIKGIKSGNLVLHRTLLRSQERPGDFVQMYSDLDSFDIAYGYGIDKNLDGMFSCTPATAKRMYDALTRGDRQTAATALDEILALRDYFVATGTLMPTYTYAMNLLGCEGNFGMDYQKAPTPEQKATVAAMLKEMGEI